MLAEVLTSIQEEGETVCGGPSRGATERPSARPRSAT
jgi:hypothetical protein